MEKKSLGQVAYESSPEGSQQNWGKWKKTPDIVKQVYEEMATGVLIEIVVRFVRDLQLDLLDSERLSLWQAIQAGYCPYCSGAYLPCYCQRDD